MYNDYLTACQPNTGYSPVLDGDLAAGIIGGGCNNLIGAEGSLFNSSPYGNFGNLGNYGSYGAYSQKTLDMLNNKTPEQLLDFQKKMQEDQMDANFEIQKKQMKQSLEMQNAAKSLEFQANAAIQMIQEKAQILHKLIKENRQDEVMDAYKDLRQAVLAQLEESGVSKDAMSKVLYGDNKLEKEKDKAHGLIDMYVKKAYYEATGSQLIEDIEANGDGAFMHGVKSMLPWTNNKSAGENIYEITGVKEDKSTVAKEWAGRILTGGTLLAGITAAFKFFKK